MKNKRQQGLATVEFSIIAVLFFILIFGVIEIGRAYFYLNTMTEATRRGARVATICPPGDLAIVRTAVFNAANDTSSYSDILSNLSPSDIAVTYLDINGGSLVPSDTTYADIKFVRVAINSANTISLNVPFFNIQVDLPPFETTLWRESLGGNQETSSPQCIPSST